MNEKINHEKSAVRCHYYATKKRDWYRWGNSERIGPSKSVSFRMFMRVIRGNFRVRSVFFGGFHRMGARSTVWPNS